MLQNTLSNKPRLPGLHAKSLLLEASGHLTILPQSTYEQAIDKKRNKRGFHYLLKVFCAVGTNKSFGTFSIQIMKKFS
jgi:hypothetical protein